LHKYVQGYQPKHVEMILIIDLATDIDEMIETIKVDNAQDNQNNKPIGTTPRGASHPKMKPKRPRCIM